MEVVIARCAGLDVHQATVAACVRVQGPTGHITQEVRTFGTTTTQLRALVAWLQDHGVMDVAMEATGVLWKPVWHVLEPHVAPAAGESAATSAASPVGRADVQ